MKRPEPKRLRSGIKEIRLWQVGQDFWHAIVVNVLDHLQGVVGGLHKSPDVRCFIPAQVVDFRQDVHAGVFPQEPGVVTRLDDPDETPTQ